MRKTPEATRATLEACAKAVELAEKITEHLRATITSDAAQTDSLHWGHHGTAASVREDMARIAATLNIIDIDELESTGAIVYVK